MFGAEHINGYRLNSRTVKVLILEYYMDKIAR